MKRFITSTAAACALVLPAVSHAGAFGIDMGMPLSKLKVLETVETHGQVSIVTVTAPTPNGEFSDYMVIASPSTGVCKVSALGVIHKADNDGTITKAAYAQLKSALTSKYGASKDADYLKDGSPWTGRDDWSSSIYQKDRVLSAFWDNAKTLPRDLANITLNVKADGPSNPYVTLTYEFSNFPSCLQQMNAKDGEGL